MNASRSASRKGTREGRKHAGEKDAQRTSSARGPRPKDSVPPPRGCLSSSAAPVSISHNLIVKIMVNVRKERRMQKETYMPVYIRAERRGRSRKNAREAFDLRGRTVRCTVPQSSFACRMVAAVSSRNALCSTVSKLWTGKVCVSTYRTSQVEERCNICVEFRGGDVITAYLERGGGVSLRVTQREGNKKAQSARKERGRCK